VTVGGNPVIANGPMANLGSNLFLNGNANGGSSADLVELTSGGALKTIAAGANPIDMISTTVGVQGSKTAVNDLFFNGYGANSSSDNQTSQSGHLYVSNGSSVSELGGSSVKNPVDLTSLTFTNLKGQQQTDVFFNGTDNNGNQGLYMVTANGSGGVTNPTKIAFQTGNGAGAADLDPQSLAVANGKLYFVGNETGQYTGTLDGPDTSPEGLWVYDPNSGGASNQNGGGEAQLVSAKIDGSGSPVTIGQSNYDLNASMNPGSQNTINPQAELASVGGNLYFNADHGGTNGGLFVYDPSNGTIYNHLGNSQGSTPYNLAAVSVS
jgi:hypothetical protein